ncbi:hypothetical protein ACN9MH_21140 [Paenibacillus silvae]|jgi:filamentous hemagglutinin|uniref:hypothetical protein n=1 Tax=Paenibacillus TaxID=44249 RepID=UPI001C1032FA|nr:hypothetical protein [Paenibacillus barcinonensis]MBU5354061.1 hypothetical protein [Paenibacillus barcinonensis]
MKKIFSSILAFLTLFSISTSAFADVESSKTTDPYAPTITYEQNLVQPNAISLPNGIPITVSPSYTSLGVWVGNIGADSLDNVTVSGTATAYGTLAPKSGSVPPVVGKTFVWNVPMTKTQMVYNVTIRVVDGSGTRNLTGNARLEYSEAQLATLGWHKGTFSTRGASLEYHFNKHKGEVLVNNLYNYLLAAGTLRDDIITNPSNYTKTVNSGSIPAHKYKHKTSGRFAIITDSGNEILSFGR